VTGHRLNRVGPSELAAGSPSIEQLLRTIATAAHSSMRSGAYFAEAPAQLRVLSSLAEGSDRTVAMIAIDAGFTLHALLPFSRDDYAADFAAAESDAEYRDLLGRAERVFELPGDRADLDRGYDLAARALVAHSDILIALWDGDPGRGPGGTAAVVAMALARGIPVFHWRPAAPAELHVRWSGFAALPVARERSDDYPAVRCDDAIVASTVERLLLPADEPNERRYLAGFYTERERRVRLRIEYPLLLAATGVRRLSAATFRAPRYADETVRADTLKHAHAWSDQLANHFAQTFRSGHVLNFSLSAAAVLFALSGLVFPAIKFWLIVAELAIISLLIVNTQVGRARQWHRRWLDYRYLAECLRPMQDLQRYGLIGPASRRAAGMPQRWPDWYAEAIWRDLGCPSGRIDRDSAGSLNRDVVTTELTPQVDYHRATAHRMHTLEHRLHGVGNALFIATIVVCLGFIVGYFAAHDWTVAHAPLFTAITAGLPALGGAIYGIRVQGDFGGTASRSLKAAEDLARLRDALLADPPPPFAQAAALFEAAARVMLSDLPEWQLAYRQRGLAIPA